MILSMKGYFIKAAQTLCCAGLIPEEFVEVFAVLMVLCRKEPFEVVKAIVEAQLGCLLAEVSNDFDPEAVTAASIEQMRFATLTDEARTPVAVKAQYPTVEPYFRMDVSTIEFILR